MTAVVGELEAAPVADTEPAPSRRKRIAVCGSGSP